MTVFKGGTAFNGLLRAFQMRFPHATYIVPITDDGGSSREIWRVFDGPSIGDLRSTLTRLSDESTEEACAVKKLLEHRLPVGNQQEALSEWHSLLEDNHSLYTSISSKYKELIRCFLCKFEAERLQRISSRFDMRNGSVGNFFFSGARMTLGNLETAIFMYSSVARIPSTTQVLPIIDSNDRLGIGVKFDNGEVLIGQHAISHPAAHGRVDKSVFTPLSSSIKELFYVDKFKNIIAPKPHPEVIRHIRESASLIYGMGSLWTSIIPSLVLEGVGEAIAALTGPKIVLLNCCHDRETLGMDAFGYIQHITASLNRYGTLSFPATSYITHLFMVEGCAIPTDESHLSKLGIRVERVPKDPHQCLSIQDHSYPIYSSDALIERIVKIVETT